MLPTGYQIFSFKTSRNCGKPPWTRNKSGNITDSGSWFSGKRRYDMENGVFKRKLFSSHELNSFFAIYLVLSLCHRRSRTRCEQSLLSRALQKEEGESIYLGN